jgi:pyruvate dehydrogenase E1 component alpha subunit
MDLKYELSKKVLENRRIQIFLAREINNGTYKIPVHLALGHESIATAIVATSRTGDLFALTHRNLHFHIALGADFESIDCEYKLLEDGLSGGSLGSMNMTNSLKGNVYTSNILANNLAVANGLALSLVLKKESNVVWAVTGDGAIEEGTFFESLIIAAALDLPVIFIVENNQWSLGSKIEDRRKKIDLKNIGEGLGINYFLFTGNSVNDYHKKLLDIRNLSIKQKHPIIVEFEVTTLGGYQIEEDSSKRYINYHAGGLKIMPNDNYVFEETKNDPVFVESINL